MLFEQKLNIILQTITEWAIQGNEFENASKTKIYEEPSIATIGLLLESIPKDSYTPFLGGILNTDGEELLVWKRENLSHDNVLEEAGIKKPICFYINTARTVNISGFSGVCDTNHKYSISPKIAQKVLLEHPTLKELHFPTKV